MFRVTFIGHQGWMVATDDTVVLLDPLLGERFGHDPAGPYLVHPPRRFDFATFPRVDAVVISHEHEDHFNLPSLARIDRRVPVYLSDRSSSAARRIVAELGFTPRLLHPWSVERIGGLELRAFAQSMAGNHPGEWDTLALHLRDLGGDGSFFTTVDHRVARVVIEALRRERLRPHLWTWPDNETDASWLLPWRPHLADDTPGLERDLRELVERTLPRELEPTLVLVCGNGLSFRDDTEWMNRALFNRDTRAACERLNRPPINRSAARTRFAAPRPGDAAVMRAGVVVAAGEPSPFLAPRDPAEWPPHEATVPPGEAAARFRPATGIRALDEPGWERLVAELAALGRALYASPLFMALYEFPGPPPAGRAATLALQLLDGEERAGQLWAYHPWEGRFVHAPDARPEDFLAGLTVWASDLLAVLEGRIAPSQVVNGRVTTWNAAPDQFRGELFHLLTIYGHPLRLPEAYLALYRAQLRALAPATTVDGCAVDVLPR